MRFRRILPICSLIGTLVASACNGAIPLPIPMPAFPEQDPQTTHLLGDSATFTTYYGTSVTHDYATSASITPGSTAYADWDGYPATEEIPDLVAAGKMRRLVWALGLNEVFLEGWDTRDELIWTDLLGQQTPSSTCIVLVLPWASDYDTSRPPAELDKVRAWMTTFAETHDNAVLVDWKPVILAHPEYHDESGVHLANGTGGPEARDNLYREGLAQCAA